MGRRRGACLARLQVTTSGRSPGQRGHPCRVLTCAGRRRRLISQVAEEIWLVSDGTVKRWTNGIEAYKEHLKATHEALSQRQDLA